MQSVVGCPCESNRRRHACRANVVVMTKRGNETMVQRISRGLCVSSERAKIPWAAFKDDRQGYVASNHGGLFALSTASPLSTSRFSG